ncbi:hypothetical protein FAIPA1_10468 [Frankia sp. AiPs1]
MNASAQTRAGRRAPAVPTTGCFREEHAVHAVSHFATDPLGWYIGHVASSMVDQT